MTDRPMLPRRSLVPLAAALGIAGTGRARAAATPVSVGTTGSLSDVAFYIADHNGYFAAEDLAVNILPFNSAANMVAPLGAGQLDVGGGSASAGLYNAVARGIRIRIVADKASSQPGYPANKIIVRKDLVAGGRYTGLASLKGMKIAMNGVGVSNTATLNTALRSVGLTYDAVNTVDMSFPDHLIALRNHSVDAGVTTEPTATACIAAGVADVAATDDKLDPGHQIAVLLYSQDFSARRDIATRFMRAYLRAVGFYNQALKDGRLAGPTAEAVIDIIAASTALKDKAVLRAITPTGCNPDGQVNVASLQRDLDFYRSRGWATGNAKVSDIVDQSFLGAARAG